MKAARPLKLIWPAQLGLTYNLIILLGVVANQSWAHSRAAGGQYTDFPIVIRIVYLFMAIGTVILFLFLRKLVGVSNSPRDLKIARFLGWLFFASTVLQLVSTSSQERWNAIAAATIAVTFILIARRGQLPKAS